MSYTEYGGCSIQADIQNRLFKNGVEVWNATFDSMDRYLNKLDIDSDIRRELADRFYGRPLTLLLEMKRGNDKYA